MARPLKSCIFSAARPLPSYRPLFNTVPLFRAFDASAIPLQDSPSSLRPQAWKVALQQYPGSLPRTLFGVLIFGAMLGFEGPETLRRSKNLTSAELDSAVIDRQIAKDLALRRVAATVPQHPYISSPLGLVPKGDGGFRRIHHLSHPPGESVNDYIPRRYGALRYVSRSELLGLVKKSGRNSLLIKRDLAEAFRHITIALQHRWLMGFFWCGLWYHETCLSFGLRTAPFIFNMFAEGLHWLLLFLMPTLLLAHYLDDFIAVIPPNQLQLVPEFIAAWDFLTNFLGFNCNASKDGQGTTLECLGIEIDTEEMMARLPTRKHEKATRLVHTMLAASSVTRAECEEITGFLNFCSEVVPLGRTHLQRVYSFMKEWHRPRARRPLSAGARKDLLWWSDLLPLTRGIQLLDKERRQFHLFTDACDYGMGGFWYEGSPAEGYWQNRVIPQENWFVLSIPQRQHINISETEVIGVALQKWSDIWKHGTLVIHTDNKTALSGFNNKTTRGDAMDSLRQSLLLAAAMDIVLAGVWISTKDNGLADAISRFDWRAVANLCPNWQIPSGPNLRKITRKDYDRLQRTITTPSCYGQESGQTVKSNTTQLSGHLKLSAHSPAPNLGLLQEKC